MSVYFSLNVLASYARVRDFFAPGVKIARRFSLSLSLSFLPPVLYVCIYIYIAGGGGLVGRVVGESRSGRDRGEIFEGCSYLEELPILLILAPSAVLLCSLEPSQSVISHSEVSESLSRDVVDGGLRWQSTGVITMSSGS